MSSNSGYYKTEVEFDGNEEYGEEMTIWTTSRSKRDIKSYSYEDAINMSGTGWYSMLVMTTTSLSISAMSIDMFGYSVVVGGSKCEFNLDLTQTRALLSVPFMGAIIMSYLWGYISDTRGRRYCLIIGMWGSFIASSLGAFSPYYIVSGLLRLISTSFCCSAQATTYVLLGECCSQRARGSFMLILTAILNLSVIFFMVPAYYILSDNFILNIWGISIRPWRILTLVLALPLGVTAVLLHFMYESPKFLANAGQKDEALEVLRRIWTKNGNNGKYPVERLIFKEDNNISRRSTPLLQSLRQQTVPLFKPPLLLRTLQLYYMTIICFSVCNGLIIWFPFIAEAFFAGLNSSGNMDSMREGLCCMLDEVHNSNTTENVTCSVEIELKTIYLILGQGFTNFFIMMGISAFASWKKMMTMLLFFVASLSGLGAVLIQNNWANFVLFFGIVICNLCSGLIFSYFVDLYPTSYRGMVACLGTIVARSSALVGVNVFGAYMLSHCSITLYACAACIFSAAIVAIFLPPDRPKTKSVGINNVTDNK